jgi:WD40-like Beta Propeller Repeat
MRRDVARFCGALILLATSFSPGAAAAADGDADIVDDPAGGCGPADPPCFRLASTIAFASTRDNPADPLIALEVYLINPDGANPRRLTDNTDDDAFAALSPDGKQIVFDSNRNRAESEVQLCQNVPPVPDPSVLHSDLFLMVFVSAVRRHNPAECQATRRPHSWGRCFVELVRADATGESWPR